MMDAESARSVASSALAIRPEALEVRPLEGSDDYIVRTPAGREYRVSPDGDGCQIQTWDVSG